METMAESTTSAWVGGGGGEGPHQYDSYQDTRLVVFLFQALLGPSFLFFAYGLHCAFRNIPRQSRMKAVKMFLPSSCSNHPLGEGKQRVTVDYESFFASKEYTPKHFIYPMVFCYLVQVISFSLTHPYILSGGWHKGILETSIDIYQAGPDVPRAVLTARVLFWGWLGAFIYSFSLCFDRLMGNDLSPKVFIFCCKRSLLALIVGSAITVFVGTAERATGVSLDVALGHSAVVAFVVGFFPERGMDFLISTLYDVLKLARPGQLGEMSLGEVEGLNIWQQGRLNQEGIENLQNLALCDILQLVIRTNFPAATIVDWIDQAIFKSVGSRFQEEKLKTVGIKTASDLISLEVIDRVNAQRERNRHAALPAEEGHFEESSRLLDQLSNGSELSGPSISMLIQAIKNHPNFKVIAHFKWKSSCNPILVDEAFSIESADLDTKNRFERLRSQVKRLIYSTDSSPALLSEPTLDRSADWVVTDKADKTPTTPKATTKKSKRGGSAAALPTEQQTQSPSQKPAQNKSKDA